MPRRELVVNRARRSHDAPDHNDWMGIDGIARVYRDLADDPETVHASEIDLRHPNDELRF